MPGPMRWQLKSKYLFFGDFVVRGVVYVGDIVEEIPPRHPPLVRLRHPDDPARSDDVPYQLLVQVD